MRILKMATAAMVAGVGAVVISGTAFATTVTTTASASPTASPATTATASPRPSTTPTPAPVATAGALTIALSCDTGRTGLGTFTVTANGKSATASVKCGGSSAVSDAAWKAGSKAVIHQTSAAAGALRAADVSLTLKAAAQSVSIRNFRAAVVPQTATQTATLAQTGGGVPLAPIGLGLAGLLLAAMGTRLVVARR